MNRLIALALALPLLTLPAEAAAQTLPTATAELVDADGERIGEVRLRETPYYGVLMEVEATGLSEGVHAFHIHETGTCETPSFESAGGHYAPRGRDHGMLVPEGKHAGDLVNVRVGGDGALRTERLAHEVTLREGAPSTLFDDDGSAVVIHEGADDYRSQPSGAAGSRVACGVIER